jgi:hypothetical protein
MDQRTRDRNDLLPQQQAAPGDGAPDGTHLREAQREGDRFLSAGDDAIRRALSGSSRDFLLHSRQRGGQ